MIHDSKPLSLTEVKRRITLTRGAAAILARQLAARHGKTFEGYKSTISQWLKGKCESSIVEAAARKMAKTLKKQARRGSK